VRLKLPRDGRRRFEGTLAGVEGDAIVLEVEGERVSFAFGDVDRARLVPDV
jgi:ribosome maturation factor RimP